MPRNPNVPCSQCGKLCWPSKRSGDSNYTPPTLHLCNPCRRERTTYRPKNKRILGIVETWECRGCGAECSRPSTKGQRPKWCEECRRLKLASGHWISVQTRLAIYESDEWTCWLCEESVDRALIGTRSPWRPSLDHVIPKSRGGSHNPANLRLAHVWCNSVRSDGRAYKPEDFRGRTA